jgi:iron complex outermembrane receptor protein
LYKLRPSVRFRVAICSLAAPLAAQAQSTPGPSAADTGQIQEIVVTAQRRETSLQNTPIAVTAVTGATISQQGLLDIRDVERLTPGLEIGGDSELGIIPIVIRGIGTTDPEGTTQDSPVAVYSDGVYISRPFGGIFSLPDADRIEVLRGPQGTLFGRNSSAGAIQVITKQPDGVFEGASDVSYGSFSDYTVRGYVLLPTSADTGFKFATAITGLGGWAYNSAKDESYGGEDSRLVRGSFRFKHDDTDLIIQADHSWGASRSHFVNVVLEPNQPIDQDTTNAPSNESRNATDVSATLKQKLPFADLDMIGAYVRSEDLENYDADGSQLDLVNLERIHQIGTQYSLETRLTSNTSGPLHWMGGTFLFAEDDTFNGNVVVGSAVTGGAPLPISKLDNNSKTRSASVFGEAGYDVTDKLQFTLGGRYTYDYKSFIGRNLLNANPIAVDDSQSWPAFTPRAILQYKFTTDTMAYVSASKGFRSGTWSVTASSPIPAKPETVWNYETGFKTNWFDRRMQVDIAPGVTAVRNAASAQIKGVELEFRARPTSRLTLSGNFSYLHAVYGTYIGAPSDVPPGVSDIYSGNQLPYAPHLTSLLDAAYTFVLADESTLVLDGSWHYRSRTFYSRENIDIESSASFNDYDLSLSWRRDEHLTTTAYVTNLTDERHPIQIEDFLNEGFGVPTQYNRPREVGIRLNFKF